MKTPLYNVAHPLTESGKPIFIPFGEWNYDGQSRQRLDRAHGEKIANELNARVAKGDPGIPVYQGHPDVPALASKYPDKGALGWITRIELVNESPDGRAVPGLALTVEWDRDPGRGFCWFSPYWLANSRDGGTYIVDEIASIGLVNNPNIPEFRLANEEQPMKKKLNPAIIELAAKYDRLANEANFDESKHPRADDGKFSSGGGDGGSSSKESGSEKSSDSQAQAKEKLKLMLKNAAVSIDAGGRPSKDDVVFEYRHKMYYVGKDSEHMVQDFVDRGLVKRVKGYHRVFENDGKGISRNAFHLKDRGAMSSLAKELAARFDAARKPK